MHARSSDRAPTSDRTILLGEHWSHAPGDDAFVRNTAEQASEARLIALVLDSVTSAHSRRSYRTGLVPFFIWVRTSRSVPTFTKALVGEYRASLLEAGLSAATVNLRLAPVRRLAREVADNGLLDPAVAAAVGQVTGVARHGTRLENWLTKEQATDLLNAP